MWYVFNITEMQGYVFKSRIKLFAVIVAHVMGAYYDYGTEQQMKGW